MSEHDHRALSHPRPQAQSRAARDEGVQPEPGTRGWTTAELGEALAEEIDSLQRFAIGVAGSEDAGDIVQAVIVRFLSKPGSSQLRV